MPEVSNDLIYTKLCEISGSIGGLQQASSTHSDRIEAVNSKANGISDKLTEHVNDTSAHGAAQAEKMEAKGFKIAHYRIELALLFLAASELYLHFKRH